MTFLSTKKALDWIRQPACLRGFILFCVGSAALLFAWLPPFPALENALHDFFIRTHAQHLEEKRIAIIDIDESSIAAIGPWPWPRSRIADLIEILLVRYKVRAIGLDMIFPNPSDPTGDARLAMLAEHGPITLSTVFDFANRHPPIRQGVIGAGNASYKPFYILATGYLGNHAGFRSPRCVGNIGFIPDSDGLLRRIPLYARFNDMYYPTLSLALLNCFDKPKAERSMRSVKPINGLWTLPFRYTLDSYLVIPAKEILEQRFSEQNLIDRYVLIGSSAFGISDNVPIPLGPSVSGVFVHAQALSTLLDAASEQNEPVWSSKSIFIIWILFELIVSGWLLPRISPWSALALLFLLSSIWLVIIWINFLHLEDISLSAPLLTNLLLLLLAVPYEWWNERRKFRCLTKTFSRYVAPSVIKEIQQQWDFKPLQPSIKDITVLIADMENYTNHITHLSLAEAARFTRDFLECLTAPVLETGGTIDRYTGDGIVAFWGAPLPISDHAERALAAANKMHTRVASFSYLREKNGLQSVRVRIGIESGKALVGDLGTTFRSSYTAVGDCINFAAKLQQAGRYLGVDIVLGPRVSAIIRNVVSLTFVGKIKIEGMVLDCWSPGEVASKDAQEGTTKICQEPSDCMGPLNISHDVTSAPRGVEKASKAGHSPEARSKMP